MVQPIVCALVLSLVAVVCSAEPCVFTTAAVNKTVISSVPFSNPSDVLAVDLNKDGAIDVVGALVDEGAVVWFRNNGKGMFPTGRLVIDASAAGVLAIFAADLNGDNSTDILAGCAGDSTVVWYPNTGQGPVSFGPKRIIASFAPIVRSVFAADLNGDRSLDVLYGISGVTKAVIWYRNNGTGGFPFGPVVISSNVSRPYVFAADLTNDGSVDVIVADDAAGVLSWYRNDGTGSFPTGRQLLASPRFFYPNPVSVATADLTDDGLVDVVSAWVYGGVVLYLNKGTGFSSPQLLSKSKDSGTRDVSLADMNNDGFLDIVMAELDVGVTWMMNFGSGDFRLDRSVLNADPKKPVAVAVADLDGNGLPDVVSASSLDNSFAWSSNDFQSGFEVAAYTMDAKFDSTYGVVFFATLVADITNDGAVDIIFSLQTESSIGAYKNDGDGTFSGGREVLWSTRSNPRYLAVADLNRDTYVLQALVA